MTTYLLKSGLLLLLFYAVYKLWLENEKMFRFNRAYLLMSLIFSFLIPLQLLSFKPLFNSNKSLITIQLEEIVVQTNTAIQDKINVYEILLFVLGLTYITVALVLSFRFILNLYTLYLRSKKNKRQIINGKKVVLIDDPILPHSFWNTIFVYTIAYENGEIPSELIAHEEAHLAQKHSFDIVFVELLQIVFWFNPFIVLYKKAIKLNHEFLADEAVNIEFNSVTAYQNLLLDIASNKTSVALASNINYLLTKKRFLMMTKKESPVKIALKVFSVAVIFSLLLFVFSTKTAAQESINTPESEKIDTKIKQPEFPGGMNEFYKMVGMNFKTPAEADKNKAEGMMKITFMVEKDGSLTDFKVVKDLGYGLADEAIRVIKLSPKWIPGSENGKPVRVLYTMPITIQPQE
ncbi:M56 family metallopeptidase [Flavobacterium cheongpyeongense]|nr:M56 family metallopeptidase [Flavobacterium cheongpyeongense]